MKTQKNEKIKISLRLDKNLLNAIDKFAEENYINRTTAITLLLNENKKNIENKCYQEA